MIKWSVIESECLGYREAFVETFKKYKGMITDEVDGNGAVKVTQSSFARHTGIAEKTFNNWVQKASGRAMPARPGPDARALSEAADTARKEEQARSDERQAKAEADALRLKQEADARLAAQQAEHARQREADRLASERAQREAAAAATAAALMDTRAVAEAIQANPEAVNQAMQNPETAAKVGQVVHKATMDTVKRNQEKARNSRQNSELEKKTDNNEAAQKRAAMLRQSGEAYQTSPLHDFIGIANALLSLEGPISTQKVLFSDIMHSNLTPNQISELCTKMVATIQKMHDLVLEANAQKQIDEIQLNA